MLLSWWRKTCIALVLIFLAPGASLSEAGSLGKAVEKGAARSILRKAPVYRRPLGSRHYFQENTRLERYTNRPRTDKLLGLRKHSFWTRSHPGRRATAANVQRKLSIPHPVRNREVITVPPRTAYHERPIKGGLRRSREVILEKRVPGKRIELKGRLARR